MRKAALYARLAVRGMRSSGEIVGPLALAMACCAAMCYILRFLAYNELIPAMQGSIYVQMCLSLGAGILALITVWIGLYANGFVLRRRTKELGLYHILGLRKRDIACVMAVESALLYIFCTAAGVALGVLLSKAALLGLLRLLAWNIPMGFDFSAPAARETAIAFAALFAFLLVRNLFVVSRLSPVELLRSADKGEREPRTQHIAAVLGVLALGAGYYIALTAENPLMAITGFFIAAGLVIAGTQLLFGAGGVALFKALRRSERFYYQPKNFAAVSGMIYRMNQNARGLANICILLTSALVCVSGTVALYAGIDQSIREMFPHAITINRYIAPGELDVFLEMGVGAAAERAAKDALAGHADDVQTQRFLSYSLAARQTEDGSLSLMSPSAADLNGIYEMMVMTQADYNRLHGGSVSLMPGEALIEGFDAEELRIGSLTYRRAGGIPSATTSNGTAIDALRVSQIEMIVPDVRDLLALRGEVEAAGRSIVTDIRFALNLDPAGMTGGEIMAMEGELLEAARGAMGERFSGGLKITTAASFRQYMIELDGSFVFLGIFLALLFSVATVLLIYYKQISEGYDDRERFVIMQKVGMSAAEVRQSIRSQVLLIFFLPLVMAGIHLLAASKIIVTLLKLLSTADFALFAGCAMVTFALFGALYVAVYTATARRYYRIVLR